MRAAASMQVDCSGPMKDQNHLLDTAASMAYAIKLVDFPGLPEDVQASVIRTFREVLEQRLGGSGSLLLQHAAYMKACESTENPISQSEAKSAAAFMVAQRLAERAAFENLARPLTARFVLHPH